MARTKNKKPENRKYWKQSENGGVSPEEREKSLRFDLLLEKIVLKRGVRERERESIDGERGDATEEVEMTLSVQNIVVEMPGGGTDEQSSGQNTSDTSTQSVGQRV